MSMSTSFARTGLATVLAATALCTSAAAQAASSESADAHIIDVVAITRVYADGLKVAAVAIQYDRNIRDASLTPADFAVQTDVAGQRITRVYTSSDGLQATGRALNGKFVILELSTDYELPVPVKKVPTPPMARPAGPPAPPAARPEVVVEPIVLNPEVVARVGNIAWEPALHPATLKSSKRGGNGKSVTVSQTGEITTMDGIALGATAAARDNVYVRNLIVDGFMKPDFASTQGNVKYNIHFPANYDPGKTYPMVVYLSDSDSPLGFTHAEYLVHGLGAVVWADKEDEARHPAIVLVPTYPRPLINESYEPTVETRPNGQTSTVYPAMLELLAAMMDKIPNLDRSRIYLTGQGDGARAAIRMMADRPNLFAAALLFAPDYDATRAASLATSKMWIVASAGDMASRASMDGFAAGLRANGARVSTAEWNGRADAAKLASNVRALAAKGGNVQYTVLSKGTVVAAGLPDDAAHNHAYTWRLGYSMQPVRDWLFEQTR